jgi:hypothetical protein
MVDKFDPLQPLTADQKQQVNESIKELTTLITGINKAEQAGLDVSDARERATATRDRLIKIRQTYFPNES